LINLEKIKQAHKAISPYINRTPLVLSNYLSKNRIVKLKLESLQITNSFKLRGATNKLLSLDNEQKQKGVIAVSTGNHGKGVAYAASVLGIQSTIYMSSMVPQYRKEAIEALGAKVEIIGNNSDEADLYAKKIAKEQNITLVHPFDDEEVIAGQGTVGLEMLEDFPEVDTVIIPTSGGGLIGGIALAMASKESLENLLGSFTIFFDRPFTVGDVVNAGNVTGVVEKVGFRSTRIRTFDKSIVTVPNKNMISAELDNLGERPVRRAKFNIGLTYDSSTEQIKAVVKDIQEMIDKHPKTNQDGRVRFQEFGGSSLDIMVMYFVSSPNWDDFIDTKQDINYQIMEIVAKNKCEFAFPSTTVYLQK